MSTALLHGLPVLLVIALVALIYRGRRNQPTYRLSEPFTHEPILWAATDEVVPGGGVHGHGASDLSVGGGVSGRW